MSLIASNSAVSGAPADGKITEPSPAAQETKRVFDICNACRYCEGYCATFQSLSMRREVRWDELDYLTNLCHDCNACFHACQYSPPHEFNINAPLAFSQMRAESYRRYAWPRSLGVLFETNGLLMCLVTAITLSVTLILGTALINSSVLFGQHVQPGAFYEIVSHGFIVATAGTLFLYAILVLAVGVYRYWRAMGPAAPPLSFAALRGAIGSAATLQHLGGGHGEGCNTRDASFNNQRRVFHQLTMWGFLLCFAATCVATIYETFLGKLSPFPYTSLPVILGTVGGMGLLVGTPGLAWVKFHSDPRPKNPANLGMDYGFLALLFLVSLTGLALLVWRETTAMGLLLLVHLGFVYAFFITMPYSKFVHGIYRFAALVRFHGEQPGQKAD